MAIKIVSDAEFKTNLRTHGVTVADFGAHWCPPCKNLLPILEELDRELDDTISILKIDVDESPYVASEFGIMSMPTVIIFKNAQPVEKLVGLRPKAVYTTVIKNHLSS